VLRVTDNGPGIAPDVLPHIFEPFFTTRKAGEGTGLGLATCDGIVSRLGGRIDVKTAPGQGTTMSVFIPVAAAH
jgi:two-component system NtrC family sensor kinase